MKKKTTTIHTSGKRKSAIARATLKSGKGIIRVNGINLENYEPEFSKLKIMEPFILANNIKDVDVNIRVQGGGITSQADAARLAVARALVEKSPGLKETFVDYDRTLLVADVRRRESSKPNSHGQARSKRQKSYR